MKLTVIRHTRVDVPAGICYGQSDVPLAVSYPEELKQVKACIDGEDFDVVFCSLLSRCRQLANDLFPGENIQFDDRLMELDFGQWEMQPWNDISETPEAKAWFDDFVEVRCPGGESFREQINRTASFLEDLKEKPYNAIAVVAHGGILRALDCLLNGTVPRDAFRNQVDYGEVVPFTLNKKIKPDATNRI